MAIRPLSDRILVRPLQEEEKSAGGIIIPDTAREKPQEGEVIAVGPGLKKEDGSVIKPNVKVREPVLYGKYAGTEVSIDGEDLIIVKESDILGVLEITKRARKAA